MNNTEPSQINGNEKQQPTATLLIPKTTIQFSHKITKYFYYQNHIMCKGSKKVIVYNTLTKKSDVISAKKQDFVIQYMPPYLFSIIEGQIISLYDEDMINQDKEVVSIKISKLEPKVICKYNKGYFMGGFNKSIFPGNKRTPKRFIYFIEAIIFDQKNKPDYTIKIKDSENPIEGLVVQNPYLLAYCRPTFYLISMQSKEIVITFQKQILNFLILEGRFASSNLNGIGVSIKNTIFTFDVERFPLYGVEVTEHLYTCQCLCLERTGRVFGGHSNTVFEYHPFKKYSKCWAMYPESESVISICCTPNNSLMVLRSNSKGMHFIDVFGLD